MTKKQREFDIIVWGATGFTGVLVAEYLAARYGNNAEVRWALAGRNQEKLEATRAELGLQSDHPLIVADANDTASVQSLVERTRVVLTTVGPYQLYGSALVAACAAAGTDYVDLCGEPTWMHEMIEAHAATATASGARIVFSCGFDSVPFDLGVYYLQQEAQRQFGEPMARVKGRVRGLKGTFSGGTTASFKATVAAAAKQPALLQILTDAFSLTPGFTGPAQPSGTKPMFDESLDAWLAPFVMAIINTKNVHRTNQLLGHRYGEDFVYDEMLITGPGEKGEQMAQHIAKDRSIENSTRQPGEGPSKEERESGYFDLLFIGEGRGEDTLCVGVKGDRDPGYGATSKMITECAICLISDADDVAGGIWTPGAALGSKLIDRLQQNAGMSFQVEHR